MKDTIENAISNLTNKVKENTSANDALKFTQAALNLAHTLATLAAIKKGE